MQSTTTYSGHPTGGGQKAGARWTYTATGSGKIHVRLQGKSEFDLYSCR